MIFNLFYGAKEFTGSIIYPLIIVDTTRKCKEVQLTKSLNKPYMKPDLDVPISTEWQKNKSVTSQKYIYKINIEKNPQKNNNN